MSTYKPQEHVCQYQESNLDFISRWMEREGMYYYFEQGDDAEVLVITDSVSKHDTLDPQPVRFFASAGGAAHDGSAGEALHTFTCKQHALPATVKLADYDYAKPTLDVSGTAPVSKTGIGEISVYGHRFFTPDDGKRLAKLRAEELLARQVVYRGTGTEFHLRAGYFFTLENHPRAAFDMKYLATFVVHAGNQTLSTPELKALTGIDIERVYWVEVTAIPGATQFRAVRSTPWPRIYGFENGIVGGAADSDYAQIDDQGRYNVKFKFDESTLDKDKASTWVRMLQPHGGNPEGFHFPLRNGTEVLFTFLGGDPDRPVISGVVPDAHNPSLVTSKNHTQNVMMTGGKNYMIVEDLEGKQHVDLVCPTQSTTLFMGGPRQHAFDQAPAAKSGACTVASVACSLLLDTQGSGGLDVGGSWWDDITAPTTTRYVGGSGQIEYVGIHTLNCDVDSNEWYNDHHNVVVATGRTDKVVAGGMTQDIHGGLTQTIQPGGSSTVTGGWLHKVTAQNKDDYGTWDTHVGGAWTAHMGPVTWTITGPVSVDCTTWTVKQSGAIAWTGLGNITWKNLANEHKLTVGLTTDTYVGLKGSASRWPPRSTSSWAPRPAPRRPSRSRTTPGRRRTSPPGAAGVGRGSARSRQDMPGEHRGAARLVKHEVCLIAGDMMIFK